MNNVVVRSISGVVFILAMLACLMFNKFLFAGLIIFTLVAEVQKRYLPALLRHEVGYPDPRRAVGHEIDPRLPIIFR